MPNRLTSASMQGYVQPEEYTAMLEKEWFGVKTPPDFNDFNGMFFPYSESQPFTYALTLLGLSQYQNIKE